MNEYDAYKAVCAALRAERERRGMTTARLADIVGVANSTLSQWELGNRRPPGPVLLRWASKLGMTLRLVPADMPTVDTARFLRAIEAARALLAHVDIPDTMSGPDTTDGPDGPDTMSGPDTTGGPDTMSGPDTTDGPDAPDTCACLGGVA